MAGEMAALWADGTAGRTVATSVGRSVAYLAGPTVARTAAGMADRWAGLKVEQTAAWMGEMKDWLTE